MGNPEQSQRWPRYLAAVRTGAVTGLCITGFFSLMIVANAIVHGGTVQLRRGGELPLFPLLPLYLLSGPVGGAILGLLFPLIRRSVLLAYFSGVVASLPLFTSIVVALGMPLNSTEGTVTIVLGCLTLGGLIGIVVRVSAS